MWYNRKWKGCDDMASIFDVAGWFLSKEPMTPKKLQKLCYYYKAWGLALYSRDLLPESEFQAWVHGPVNPLLYAKYANYGWNDIPMMPDNSNLFDEKETDLLKSVWETYGEMTANALEAQTHTEDPWRSARQGIPDYQNCTSVISNDAMGEYYRRVYQEEQGE